MTTTSTDHTRARSDKAHSHGVGGAAVIPDKSRAERLTAWDPDAFGVPTGREENWRFSPAATLKPLWDAKFGGGSLAWDASELPTGVTVSHVAHEAAVERSVRAPGDRASAVAVARSGGATCVAIAPEVVVGEPITLALTGAGEDVAAHVLLEVGAGAEATLVIDHRGAGRYSEFVSIDVADGAALTVVMLQSWDAGAVHAGEVVARLGRDSRLRGSVVTLGGAMVRLNTSAALAGEGASIDLYGLYFADAGQHQEHQLFIDHMVPNCRSRVTYKGALAGATARTVWIGDVLIRAAAEGTDTYELNRNLVLTDGARADSVPNLEIETGQIAGAGHASATGRFDDEQMFYLRSRGIPENLARKLVVRGFFADLIHEIGVPEVEQSLVAAIDRELESVHE